MEVFIEERTGTKAPFLYSGAEPIDTSGILDRETRMSTRTFKLATRIGGEDTPVFSTDEPKFDDESDTLYLVIGGLYASGKAGRSCMYSQKVETFFVESGVQFEPVVANLGDKQLWFFEGSPDGTTPFARHRGKWIQGSQHLIDLVGNTVAAETPLPTNPGRLSSELINQTTKTMETWVMTDPANEERWAAAKSEHIGALVEITSMLGTSDFLGGDAVSREDATWFPAIFSVFQYTEALCGFQPKVDAPVVFAYVGRMLKRPTVMQCLNIEADKARVVRFHSKIVGQCAWLRLPVYMVPTSTDLRPVEMSDAAFKPVTGGFCAAFALSGDDYKMEAVAEISPAPTETSFESLFGPRLLKSVEGSGQLVDTTTFLSGCDVVGIYFGADWCKSCKAFFPELVSTYKTLVADGKKFEIVYASADRNEEDFDSYFHEMPWLAVPFGIRKRCQILATKFSIGHIPALVLLDKTTNVMSSQGRAIVNADPLGAHFPWHIADHPDDDEDDHDEPRDAGSRRSSWHIADHPDDDEDDHDEPRDSGSRRSSIIYFKPAFANQSGTLVEVRSETEYTGSPLLYIKPSFNDASTTDYVKVTQHPEKLPARATAYEITGVITVNVAVTGPVVRLNIVACADLAVADANGLSDPFVTCYLTTPHESGDAKAVKSTKHKTKVIKKTLNPTFNSRIDYDMNALGADVRQCTLELKVWDWDRFSSNDFLGMAKVSLELAAEQEGDISMQLSPRESCVPWKPTYAAQDQLRARDAAQDRKGDNGSRGEPDYLVPVSMLELEHAKVLAKLDKVEANHAALLVNHDALIAKNAKLMAGASRAPSAYPSPAMLSKRLAVDVGSTRLHGVAASAAADVDAIKEENRRLHDLIFTLKRSQVMATASPPRAGSPCSQAGGPAPESPACSPGKRRPGPISIPMPNTGAQRHKLPPRTTVAPARPGVGKGGDMAVNSLFTNLFMADSGDGAVSKDSIV